MARKNLKVVSPIKTLKIPVATTDGWSADVEFDTGVDLPLGIAVKSIYINNISGSGGVTMKMGTLVAESGADNALVTDIPLPSTPPRTFSTRGGFLGSQMPDLIVESGDPVSVTYTFLQQSLGGVFTFEIIVEYLKLPT